MQVSPAVQALPSLQPVPSVLGLSSTQACPPLAQDVRPFRHWLGLVVHDSPAVHETHAPAVLQTMFMPQDEPTGLGVLLLQTTVPVEQLVIPV